MCLTLPSPRFAFQLTHSPAHPPAHPPALQCLYYLAEKVGDDTVLTDVQEPTRGESQVG